MVVLKEVILNSFYFVRVQCCWKKWFWTVCTLGGCGGRVWWSWKNWFWTVCTLGGHGGLERTDFEQFVVWKVWWSWKKWFWTVFYFGRVWWSWKNWFNSFYFGEEVVALKEVILTVSTLGGSCGLERQTCRAAYKYVGVLDRCGGIQYIGGCPNRRRVPTSTIPIQIPLEHADAEGSIGDIQGGIGGHLNAWGHQNIQGCQHAPQV